MPAIGFVLPLLPGAADIDRKAMRSCWDGDRKEAYEDARRQAGVTREAVWIQPTPAGEVVVVYLEADDLAAAFQHVGSSQEPFDRWFRDNALEVHGVDLSQPMDPPEQILDFRA